VTSSLPSSPWIESFRLRQAAASLLLVALGWLCTGTLASYAVGLDIAIVWRPCGYLLNCDHGQFLASHLMLDGAPRATWEGSVVLRRTLYPLLAYPFAKVLGFEYGGILANFLLALAALIGFSEYIRRKVGNAGATAAALLIATYPGIHYWVGLPYSYAVIVPSSLAATAILWDCRTRIGSRELRSCRSHWESSTSGTTWLRSSPPLRSPWSGCGPVEAGPRSSRPCSRRCLPA
jgi:hypothetical protein